MAGLGNLGNRVDRLPVARDRHQRRRGREVAVPEIVLQALKVPDPPARVRVQRDDAVGEEIVAHPVHAVEVVRRRPRGEEDHPPLLVDGDAGPGVRPAGHLPRVGRPGVVAVLARVRNGVEGPANLPGRDVVGPDVARRAGQRFRHRGADDQQVPVHHARRAGAHRQSLDRPTESGTEVDPAAVVAPTRCSSPGSGVEREEPMPVVEVDAAVMNDHATIANPGAGKAPAGRVEAPELLPGGGVEREGPLLGRHRVEDPVDDHRVRLHLGPVERVLGVVGPRDLKPGDVLRGDLRQRHVVVVGVATLVDGPVGAPGAAGESEQDGDPAEAHGDPRGVWATGRMGWWSLQYGAGPAASPRALSGPSFAFFRVPPRPERTIRPYTSRSPGWVCRRHRVLSAPGRCGRLHG